MMWRIKPQVSRLPKVKGQRRKSVCKKYVLAWATKQFTCNYCKEPSHFVRDCPKFKKKNEKEKANVVIEKKDDEDKFDELYIADICLQCDAEVVKKKVLFDENVEYIFLWQAKSKNNVQF